MAESTAIRHALASHCLPALSPRDLGRLRRVCVSYRDMVDSYVGRADSLAMCSAHVCSAIFAPSTGEGRCPACRRLWSVRGLRMSEALCALMASKKAGCQAFGLEAPCVSTHSLVRRPLVSVVYGEWLPLKFRPARALRVGYVDGRPATVSCRAPARSFEWFLARVLDSAAVALAAEETVDGRRPYYSPLADDRGAAFPIVDGALAAWDPGYGVGASASNPGFAAEASPNGPSSCA